MAANALNLSLRLKLQQMGWHKPGCWQAEHLTGVSQAELPVLSAGENDWHDLSAMIQFTTAVSLPPATW